jgi:Cft2 family RNA processing exonuclease
LHRFRRNGNLDTNRLADAMQNINTVYTQRMNKQVKVNNTEAKYAFVMMIDESGSMESWRRDVFAHNTAVLFAEVFSKFKGVEYYVYGHGDKINSYLTKEKTNKYVIANYDKQGGQNDAFSYRWIINDVKRQTNLPIIVLNITDFYYHSSDKELANVIRYFKENNVSFNMITLGCNYTEREIAFTKRLLEGQVINIKDIHNENVISDGLEKLSTMIRNNYERFNRK